MRFSLAMFVLATLAMAAVIARCQTSLPSKNTQSPLAAQPRDQPATLPTAQAESIHRQLMDWPQLGRYRDDNAKLPEPAKGEQRVVFYGDSITDGWGRQHGQFFPGKPYVNRGIGGQTTPQMLVRFQQDVVALHPAAVLILAGINDIAGNTGPETLEDIQSNFRSMVAIAKHEHIRVILASVLPASRLPWRPGVEPATEVQQLNVWLQGLAKDEHLVYCDYYPALVDGAGGMREELATDKAVHPNDAGYALMAPIAEAAIRKSLALRRP